MDNSLPVFRVVAAGRGWDWIVQGFELFKRNPGIWVAITVIWILLNMAASITGAGALAAPLFAPVLLGGMLIGCARLVRDQELEINHLFAGFKQPFLPLLGVGVGLLIAQWAVALIAGMLALMLGAGTFLSGATLSGSASETAIAASVLAGLGISILVVVMVALLLYGVVLMAFTFAPALAVLGNVAPIAAIQSSFKAAWANWRPLTIASLIALPLCIIAAIPLMLGYLVLIPVLIGASYAAYRDIYPDLPEQLAEDTP